MSTRMTFGELKRYFDGRSLNRVLFCTEDQPWECVSNPLKACLAFTSMQMASNPNMICLKGGDNMMYFERVKFADVDAERTPIGTVLDVVCGDKSNRRNDIHYLLIVS